jgi:hypothetical protein
MAAETTCLRRFLRKARTMLGTAIWYYVNYRDTPQSRSPLQRTSTNQPARLQRVQTTSTQTSKQSTACSNHFDPNVQTEHSANWLPATEVTIRREESEYVIFLCFVLLQLRTHTDVMLPKTVLPRPSTAAVPVCTPTAAYKSEPETGEMATEATW